MLQNTIKYVILGVLILPTLLTAQQDSYSEPLVTDRPDATESSSVVPKYCLQVETGATFQTYKNNAITFDSYTYNTILVRYGLLDNLELRLGGDYINDKTSNNNTVLQTEGYSPLLFGAKIAIAEEKGISPEIALIGHLQLPFSASPAYKPNTTGIDFKFSLAHSLSDKSSLGYNIGAALEGDNPEMAYVYTLAYGYSITDKFGFYAELYGDLPENSSPNHYWDAGLTYLISNNFQLDITTGTSITQGQQLLLSGGFSFRLPTKTQQL